MRIPVVFAFDAGYALPASVAIASLQAARRPGTEYEVIVLHDGLDARLRLRFEGICPIRWVRADVAALGDVPTGWSGLATWYRLLLARLLPEYDRVIWSDVDVLFKGDLGDVFGMDMGGAPWAGPVAEDAAAPDGHHLRWGNNPCVHMPGFMVADLAAWRRKDLTELFIENIGRHRGELKMFDLDVLNMSCSPIAAVPFAYCVLENVMYADDVTAVREWPWLRHHYTREALEEAKREVRIVHYAGGRSPKVWMRRRERIPDEYWAFLERSPFFDREYFFPGWRTALRRLWWSAVSRVMPLKSQRQACRARRFRPLAKDADPV